MVEFFPYKKRLLGLLSQSEKKEFKRVFGVFPSYEKFESLYCCSDEQTKSKIDEFFQRVEARLREEDKEEAKKMSGQQGANSSTDEPVVSKKSTPPKVKTPPAPKKKTTKELEEAMRVAEEALYTRKRQDAIDGELKREQQRHRIRMKRIRQGQGNVWRRFLTLCKGRIEFK